MRRLGLLTLLALSPLSGCGNERANVPQPMLVATATATATVRGWTRAVSANGPGTPVVLPDVANARSADPESGIAWYRTSLRVPVAGDHRLEFAGANFEATVWLDGRRLGSHRGAYERFGFTLHGLRAGRHRLLVRTDFRDPRRQSALGFHRGWFNWGGLNGAVTLQRLARSTLERPAVATRLRGANVKVTVSVVVRNREAAARVIAVRGSVGPVAVRLPAVVVAPRSARRVTSTVRVSRSLLWSPRRPRLVALRFSVPGESSRVDMVGLRELRVSGGRLLVNGVPVRLAGASIQTDAPGRGDALRPADIARIVARLRAIGANATRAQHALDPALLAAFDRAGILVWQMAGPFQSPGRWRVQNADALARTSRQVVADRIHPSIVAWSLVNEVAGNGANAAQIAYVRRAARLLHRIDPGRPVAVDIWGPQIPRTPGPLYEELDAVGLTDYSGWYAEPLAPPAARVAATRSVAQRFTRLFPGKLRVITEFGAGASRLNPSEAVGGYEHQAQIIAEHLRVYRTTPGIGGALIWALSDFRMTPHWAGGSIRRLVPALRVTAGLNDKGLYTRDGRRKPAVDAVRRAFAR